MKNSIVFKVILVLTIIMLNCYDNFSQNLRKKAFLKLLENFSEPTEFDLFIDYKDTSSLSKTLRKKLIFSDLIDNPILNSFYEGENFIVAPNKNILESNVKIFIVPKKVIFSKDSCYFEFDMIYRDSIPIKNEGIIKGSYSLVPSKPSKTYDYVDCKSTLNVETINY